MADYPFIATGINLTNPSAPVILGPGISPLGQAVGSPVINPQALDRVRAAIGLSALGGLGGQGNTPRVDICVLSNSLGTGQGASNVNTSFPASGTVTWLNSDNYNGYVGRLRLWLNAAGQDPGEGFIYALDPRVTLALGGVSYPYCSPLGTSTSGANLATASTSTLTISVPTAPVTQYIGVIWWDQAASATPTATVNAISATMKTTPGGSTTAAGTGTGKFLVGYVPTPTPGQAVVFTAGSGGTFVSGLDLVNNPGGVHVHRMCITGLISSNLLGGSSNGVLSGTTGAGNQIDRVVRSAYQWVPSAYPGLLILADWDVNDWSYQNITKVLTCTLTNGSQTVTVTAGGTVDWSDDAKTVSGTGLTGQTIIGVTTTNVFTMSAAYAGSTGSYAVTITSPTVVAGMTPALATTFYQQFLTNSLGTGSTGPVSNLGWSALFMAGPRNPNDGLVPAPPFSQSQFIAAQKSVIIAGDPTYGNVAFMDLSQLWGSNTVAGVLGLQISASIHPTQSGHADAGNWLGRVLLGAALVGSVAAAVPP